MVGLPPSWACLSTVRVCRCCSALGYTAASGYKTVACWFDAGGQHLNTFFLLCSPPDPGVPPCTATSCSNPHSVHEVHVDEEQLSFLRTELDAAAAAGRPVVVFTHAPILGSGLKVVQTVHVKNRCAMLSQMGLGGGGVRPCPGLPSEGGAERCTPRIGAPTCRLLFVFGSGWLFVAVWLAAHLPG